MFCGYPPSIIQFCYYSSYMCFLKTLKPLDQIQHERYSVTWPNHNGITAKESCLQKRFLNTALNDNTYTLQSKQSQILLGLKNLIDLNNYMLFGLQQKIIQSEQNLILTSSELQLIDTPHQRKNFIEESHHSSSQQTFENDNDVDTPSLLTKLFGKKSYRFRLQLVEALPLTIYKQRNFNLSVRLVDTHGQKVLNTNIIHMCVGMCDADGQWITANKVGENFMKGKTGVQMYHGECLFAKIYPRQVSRQFKGGKINFVIYSKPSMVQFISNLSDMESSVDSSQIQPLILENISIKAKKH